jgi:adenine-specific DNA-methyltransferase
MNGAAVLIKYMGSKRSLAPKIANRISREHPGATVLDVFSGMCAVGSELANRHTLYTNDVHAFAEVVARSLFASSNDTPSATEISKLLAAFGRNKRALSAAMAMELKHEKRAIAAIDETNKWRRFRDFTKRELNRKFPIETNGLDSLEKYRACPQRFPYRLCASYFSNSYFGVEQAIEIDSIRYAIDQLPEKFRFRYLAALIHAVSHCAAAPGHFAQFLTPRDQQNTIYISNIRKRSILTRFLATLVSFPEADCLARDENRIFRSDATTLLKKQKQSFSKRDFVIYADPPYSKAQYSRYYHVLETLTLYDYPPCDGKGRYRADRFQTDFSRVTGVVRAMTDFVKACSNVGAPLYLSYPRNGLLSRAGGDLRSILKEHYDVVRLVAHEPLNHSTMGARPERPPSGLWRTFIMPDGSSKDASAPNGRLKLIRVDEVTRNERNPRQTFDPARIEQLAASLQEIGLQVPIRVYENPKSKRFPYVLLDGERRFRAAKLNNWETIHGLHPVPLTAA